MNELPAPLVPAEVDLRDFAFMPLDVVRLRDSDLASMEAPEACWAAVLLWCASWHQVPAASIPDDDRVLANLSGFGRVVKEWQKVREGALRGWIPCRDGRLYHPVVAEKALDAWRSKLEQRWKTECARIKKHNQRNHMSLPLPDFDVWMSQGCPQGHALPVPDDNGPPSPGTKAHLNGTNGACPQTVPRETPSKGQGEGQGQGKERIPPSAPLAADTTAKDGDSKPEVVDFVPTPAGAACVAIRRSGLQRTNPSDPRLSALLDAGATVEELVAIVPECLDKGEPWAYLLTVATNRRQRAAATALTLHRGPMQPQETPGQRAARMRIEAVSPNLVDPRFRRTATTPTEIIDVAPAQLG